MRKEPAQTRSRQMVDSLLEATARTVAERGLVDTTTNHIAARAGVSVGSLYQYFSGKDALLDALAEKLSRDLAQVLNQRLQNQLDADLYSVLRDLLTAVFDFYEADDGLYLELVRNWHHPRTERSINLLEQQLLELARLYFVRHHAEFRFENLPAMLFVAFNSAVFTGVRYLSHPPAFLRREDVIEGLVAMLAGYIQQAGPAATGRKSRRSK
jgi:AcrR family transcriptional regulator